MIGDAEAKISALGGNQKVIIATPDIKVFRIQPDHDFIVMCSDGVFDRLSNKEVIQVAWSAISTSPYSATVHQVCTRAVEAVMSAALQRRSLDNVTVTLVALPGLKRRVREGSEFRLRMSGRGGNMRSSLSLPPYMLLSTN
jgi:protein phosphatase 2C family protein 2/3